VSELEIGLVVEGPTDVHVIQAGLEHLLDTPFVLRTLQPEVPPGEFGGGWGGVLRWCRQVAAVGKTSLDDNPSLLSLDLIVIHVDADVAGATYQDVGTRPLESDLPCEQPCPPAGDTTKDLRKVVEGWLTPLTKGTKGILCIPSKCTEAWVAAALYGREDPNVLDNLECNMQIVAYLHNKPARMRLVQSKGGKFKKNAGRYRKFMAKIRENWVFVQQTCPEAGVFSEAVNQAVLFRQTGKRSERM